MQKFVTRHLPQARYSLDRTELITTIFSGFRTPFNLFVHTDNQENSSTTPETLNRGFCLNYVQQPCSTTNG